MADVEVDAGAGMGIFECIPASQKPSDFAIALKDAALACHGTAGIAWLGCLVAQAAEIRKRLPEFINRLAREITPDNGGGQVSRVARRFALVAAAGEMATQEGLTGWNAGEARRAVKTCFLSWLEGFGGDGNREDREILSQVRAFFEAHGASRFEWINPDKPDHVEKVINRAGFFRTGYDGRREYYVLPETFKAEICKGQDCKHAIKVLAKAGWLQPGEGRNTQLVRIPSLGPTRCYVFTPDMEQE